MVPQFGETTFGSTKWFFKLDIFFHTLLDYWLRNDIFEYLIRYYFFKDVTVNCMFLIMLAEMR